MGRTITFLLSAIFSIFFGALAVLAQESTGDHAIDLALQAFKAKHPDLYDMVDEEKLGQFLISIREKIAEEKKKPDFDPRHIRDDLQLNRPPIDILKPEAIQELASHRKDVGIDTKNFDPTKFDRSKRNQLVASAAAADNAPQNVVAHLQAGAESNWPEPETVKKDSDESAPKSASITPELNEHPPLELTTKQLRLPDLPRCPRDTTVKYKFGDPSRSDTTLKDVLFIRAEIPSGTDELFGKKVRVFRYTGSSDDPVSRAIASMHVLCLPFRMRLSEHVSVQDFGLNALKNYDRDFNGSGEIHPYVKRNKTDLLQ